MELAENTSSLVLGRIQMHWKGKYNEVNKENDLKKEEEILYYIIKTEEEIEPGELKIIYSKIPIHWVNEDYRYFLYPDSSYTKTSSVGDPMNWSNKTFKRHQYPIDSWVEFDVIEIIDHDKKRNFKTCRRIQKYLIAGTPRNEWLTDSEILIQNLKPRTKKVPTKYVDDVSKQKVEHTTQRPKPVEEDLQQNVTELNNTIPGIPDYSECASGSKSSQANYAEPACDSTRDYSIRDLNSENQCVFNFLTSSAEILNSYETTTPITMHHNRVPEMPSDDQMLFPQPEQSSQL